MAVGDSTIPCPASVDRLARQRRKIANARTIIEVRLAENTLSCGTFRLSVIVSYFSKS